MKCWRCGAEISDTTQICPKCNTNQKRGEPKDLVPHTLRKLYNRVGPSLLTTEDSLLLVDQLHWMGSKGTYPMRLIKATLPIGVGRLYRDQLDSFGEPDDAFYRNVRMTIMNNTGLSRKEGNALISLFDEMIGWTMTEKEYISLTQLKTASEVFTDTSKDNVENYRKAAKLGDVEAQYHLGECYLLGHGVSYNAASAGKWLKLASDQGYAPAQVLLGNCYKRYEIRNGKIDPIQLFQKAAEQGNDEAMFYLGECYYSGRFVELDETQAMSWYRKAAELGNGRAQNNLAVYLHTNEDPQIVAEAIMWFQKSAEQGNSFGQVNLGGCYVEGTGVEQSWEEAVKWYRKAAEQGNTDGQYMLGNCLLDGKVATTDADAGLKWLTLSAKLGNPSGQYHLAVRYRDGKGVKQNYAEARKWFKEASKYFLEALYEHALCLLYGKGGNANTKKAWEEIQTAAENGLPEAQNEMGKCFSRGIYVERDVAKAFQWFQQAAAQGFAEAQYNLGDCYQLGLGVKKNPAKAEKWHQLAIEQGYKKDQSQNEG